MQVQWTRRQDVTGPYADQILGGDFDSHKNHYDRSTPRNATNHPWHMTHGYLGKNPLVPPRYAPTPLWKEVCGYF